MADVRIGGQAVIEGIMMKNKEKYAIAVRKPDKEIEVKIEEYKPAADKGVFFRLPIIRGVFNFVESLVIGVKTLTYSASFYDDDDKNTSKKESSDSLMLFFTVAFSIVLAVGLFMLLPAFLVSLLDKYISSHIVLGLIEGAIRLAIFLLYVFLISRMEDIKRTFMYHGAEHKSINCLEAGNELTIENVMKASRFHKRCGTSFLFIVMIVSILVFMCIDSRTLWLRLLLRVLLVPVIAGISYEFIRYAGNHNNACANVLSKPGLWVQRLTTIEPTPDMAEVAIKAVEGVFDWKEYLSNTKQQAHSLAEKKHDT
ncbi:MAG: DUF1385 domain-containing protein [Lachnospiraceae bacterium]|nr:DUF1385 domain-containing protein [Lachnospiraceae bacterium]